MFAPFADIHWVAVIAGTVTFAVLGGLYFGALFAKQYVYATGRENVPKEEQAITGAIFMIGPLVCSLVTVIADAYFVSALKIGTVSDASVLGLIVGIGFLVPMAFNIAINPLFLRPLRYGLLNTPYFLVANVIACMLLVAITF